MPPSVSLLESDTGALHIEARTGETSAVAVASTMASLSHLTNELSLIPPSPRNNGDDLQQGSEIPSMPSACKVPDNCIIDTEMKAASACNDDVSAAVVENTGAPVSDAVDVNLNNGAEIGKIVGGKNESRMRYLDVDISRLLEERSRARELLKSCRPPISQASRRQKFKESLQKGLIDCKDVDVSFGNFPYYLRYRSKIFSGILLLNIGYYFISRLLRLSFCPDSETTKDVLIASSFIHLKCKKYKKFTSNLPTVCPRILLSGPGGNTSP